MLKINFNESSSTAKHIAEDFKLFAKMDCNTPTFFAYKDNSSEIYVLKRLDYDEPSISELIEPIHVFDEETKTSSNVIIENLKNGTKEKPKTIYSPEAYEVEYSKTPHPKKPNKFIIYYNNYLVYPFVAGKRLDVCCKTLAADDKPFEKIVKIILSICNTLAELEKFNHLIIKHNKKKGALLEGVWDINERNFIVQKDYSVILIDYQRMYTDPHATFMFLIQQSFANYAKIDIGLPDSDNLEGLQRLEKILNMTDENRKPIFAVTQDAKKSFLDILKNFEATLKPTSKTEPSFDTLKNNLENYFKEHFTKKISDEVSTDAENLSLTNLKIGPS